MLKICLKYVQYILDRPNIFSRSLHDFPKIRRRKWVRREEERLRRERKAIWVSSIRGRGVVRRGLFVTP